ncbi:MAG: hypothetical protein E5W21_18145, partial [Mesorhizobium sp.]
MPQRQSGRHGGDRSDGTARAVWLGLTPEPPPLRGVEAHLPETWMPRKLDLRTGRPVWSAYRAPA